MLLRIVRMEFNPDKLEDFKQLFSEVKSTIEKFPGCHQVELCTDPTQSNVFYTFSQWDSEVSLNAYRRSAFFDQTWQKTKALFNGKPQAFSLLTEK
jgi:quinol monooxygenase YgiN